MGGVPEIIVNSSGKKMPVIGMGTYSSPPVDHETTKLAILEAIKSGYRHFDTAFAYGTEKPLGEAIIEAVREGLINSQDDLFITTKLWSSFAEPDQVLPAIKMSLQNLQLEYVDMYLIHWPLRLSPTVKQLPPPKDCILQLDIKSVWEAMEECQNLGLTKGIGVSNFSCKKLTEILSIAKIPPAINQVEMSPCWRQNELREFCKVKGIHITAYSPLGAPSTKRGDNRVVGSSVLEEIAKAKGKTTAQVSLRWVYEQGASLVTKSFNKERMKENLDIFDWSLTHEESNKISQLPKHKVVSFSSLLGAHDLVCEIEAEI